jgi:RimJ/RimL family protein N-acetyltransferase
VKVEIERSFCYAELAGIVRSDRIYEITSDDFSSSPAQYFIPEDERLIYLVAKDGDQVLGFCAFVPVNGVTYDTHVCFLRCAYGENARLAFAAMLAWMWARTRAERIVGAVPDYNPLAVRFAERAGFEHYGRNPRSWMKGGRLHDQILLGISRPTGITL